MESIKYKVPQHNHTQKKNKICHTDPHREEIMKDDTLTLIRTEPGGNK
jgi:hypothetical protein